MLEQWLVDMLLAETSVISLIGESSARTRLHPLFIPQKDLKTKQMPCYVYAVTSESRQKTYCGTDGLVNAQLQLDSYALKLKEARELSAASRRVLVDYRGSMGGVDVRDVTLSSSLTLQDMEPGLLRVVDTYDIWYMEEN